MHLKRKSNNGWKCQHISTNEAAKMIVLGLFQLNPGLANTVGALRRKPHVEKVYGDLATIRFECQRSRKSWISPVILEKRPSYSDSCQSCCVPKPTAGNKCKILTISNSNKKHKPQCPTDIDRSSPHCHNRVPGKERIQLKKQNHPLEDNNPLVWLADTPEEEQP